MKRKIRPFFSVCKFCLYKHKHKGDLGVIRVCHWTASTSWCFAPASAFVVTSSLVAPSVHSEDPDSFSDRPVTGDGHGSITTPWKHSLTTAYRVVYSRRVPVISEWPLYNTTVLLDTVSIFDKSANHQCFSITLISHRKMGADTAPKSFIIIYSQTVYSVPHNCGALNLSFIDQNHMSAQTP
jgi:hypothetical protein